MFHQHKRYLENQRSLRSVFRFGNIVHCSLTIWKADKVIKNQE
jgi:hypothetical protein